ncbi:hypothetical protein JZ751_016781 [Albula glossodonta]|uniref:Uncharacterized protein n=1 Tax=Albula glossodonta TaxID=121402 RepID=A0A8T2NPW6_9TELE|nr:hypothetical protein JZ751_016781 [Albula glossodonta]
MYSNDEAEEEYLAQHCSGNTSPSVFLFSFSPWPCSSLSLCGFPFMVRVAVVTVPAQGPSSPLFAPMSQG